MSQLSAHFETWVRTYHPASADAVRLVCLPHAGGSASFFFTMARELSPDVEVLAVQYPGRQDRRHEPNIDTIEEFADQVFTAVRDSGDRPLALFGHSMGATIAYEVTLRMERDGLPSPVELFVSGRRAPSRHRDERVHEQSDSGVTAELQALGGISAEMLADPDVVRMIMPAIRSDYHAAETYRHEPGRKVSCPVTVLTGDSDPRVSIEEARAWEEHTTGPTELHVLPGGHFYLVEQSRQVVEVLARKLKTETERTGLTGAAGHELR